MSLYAIGDLHLHFQAPLKARVQLTDPLWKDHEERLRKSCLRLVKPEDTLLLMGDHSWGRNLAECEQDFAYIEALPGRKILLRGNHDMFWDAKKTAALNERFAGNASNSNLIQAMGKPLGERSHHLLHTDQTRWELW